MATHTRPVLGASTLPDASGNVFFEPSSVKDANDRNSRLVLVFNDTGTKIGVSGSFRVPENYVGAPKIVVDWKSTATTGDVVWDFDYTAVAPSESADPSSDQEAATATTTTNATARHLNRTEISLTAANLSPGDRVLFTLSRDGVSAADTMAAAAAVEGVEFQYSDA